VGLNALRVFLVNYSVITLRKRLCGGAGLFCRIQCSSSNRQILTDDKSWSRQQTSKYNITAANAINICIFIKLAQFFNSYTRLQLGKKQ